MIARTIFLGLIYGGLGVLTVKSVLERKEAARLWREAVGGPYDFDQKRFVVELELDQATLPPKAAKLLRLSRRDMGFALMLLPFALTIQTMNLGE